MDSHERDTEGEGKAEESVTRQPTEVRVSSEPQTPGDPAEPQPGPELETESESESESEQEPEPESEPETQPVADEPKAEASEGSDYAHVEVPENLEAAAAAGGTVQAASEAVSQEPESLSEPQPETKREFQKLDEDEDEDDDEDEDEEPDRLEKQDRVKRVKSKESRFRPSLPLTTIVEEAAAPAPRPEKEKAKESEKRDSEEIEGTGRRKKSKEEHLHPGEEEEEEEDDDFEDFEWSADVRKLQEQQLRGELVDQYHTLLVERNRYQRYNVYLQQKISETLRKKGVEAAEPADKSAELDSPEKEQTYLRYLAMLEELKKQEADDLEWYRQEVREMKHQCQEKQAKVEKEWRRFQALKKQVVMQVMGSCRMRGGRQAALREVEQIQALEDKKEKEMSALRLENVQLKQSLVHFETRMKAQEDLAEGLLLIDFEQLKIENQTFNEKVEERNEELLKLRTKVTSNVQIITHVKEKLSFIDMENSCKKAQLLEIETQVALGRDLLTKTKQARDNLRIDNIKLNQKCGLLGKESLLRDLEEKVEKTEFLNKRLESLKRHHAGLTLSCKGVKQKIREAKTFLPS
ncbi:coiled-coil domain-containing protein 96 [Phodopus roborovskii]|uniref:Ccdc96 protein n=1 Tax=Phodopus roborovskii TaxID=109678 RepID=A0AAU9ZYU4_PHORO|nr:coiled-coil domain-containing protein 96 [Phodopus roborovskii]CAH6978807.1 Ccdc96 [Phodopus roborovskii]